MPRSRVPAPRSRTTDDDAEQCQALLLGLPAAGLIPACANTKAPKHAVRSSRVCHTQSAGVAPCHRLSGRKRAPPVKQQQRKSYGKRHETRDSDPASSLYRNESVPVEDNLSAPPSPPPSSTPPPSLPPRRDAHSAPPHSRRTAWRQALSDEADSARIHMVLDLIMAPSNICATASSHCRRHLPSIDGLRKLPAGKAITRGHARTRVAVRTRTRTHRQPLPLPCWMLSVCVRVHRVERAAQRVLAGQACARDALPWIQSIAAQVREDQRSTQERRQARQQQLMTTVRGAAKSGGAFAASLQASRRMAAAEAAQAAESSARKQRQLARHKRESQRRIAAAEQRRRRGIYS
jgi:hypothetical protein